MCQVSCSARLAVGHFGASSQPKWANLIHGIEATLMTRGCRLIRHFGPPLGHIEPTEAQYLTGLNDLITSVSNEELLIRLLAWWRGNDRYRDDDQEPEAAASPTIVSLRKSNVDGLLRLLPEEDATDHSKALIRAEVLRQMGEFDKAFAILARQYPDELNGAIARLSSLCQEKDSTLRTL
jgi:hypothetical protein